MGNRQPLTLKEKKQIYLGKSEGRTLAELAKEVGCSVECARKWWRKGRDRVWWTHKTGHYLRVCKG